MIHSCIAVRTRALQVCSPSTTKYSDFRGSLSYKESYVDGKISVATNLNHKKESDSLKSFLLRKKKKEKND